MKAMKALRRRMFECDVLQSDLQRVISKSPGYVSARMAERYPFDIWEMYQISKFLQIPPEEMHLYFPPRRS